MRICGDTFIGFFMDETTAAESIAVGVQYISVVSMFYFVMGAMTVTSSVLRGSGDMRWFMSVTLINLITRVTLTYLFADATAGMIIMWANPVGWTLGFLIAYIRYRQGGWKQISMV
jgi:Na+-driven multidrug efflux pump